MNDQDHVKYDFFRQPLAVGDVVGAVATHYHELILSRIVAFTPMKVKLEEIASKYTFYKFPDQVVKKP